MVLLSHCFFLYLLLNSHCVSLSFLKLVQSSVFEEWAQSKQILSMLQLPPSRCCSCQVHEWLPLTAMATSLSSLSLNLSTALSFLKRFLLLYFVMPHTSILSITFMNTSSPSLLLAFTRLLIFRMPQVLFLGSLVFSIYTISLSDFNQSYDFNVIYMLMNPKFISLTLMSILSSGNTGSWHLILDV